MRFSIVRRYLGICRVSIQDVAQSRSIALVWFLLSIIETFSVLLLWEAGFAHHSIVGNISLPSIELYYVVLLLAGQVLISHVEGTVSRFDIKEGGLSKYLMRPVSYFWFRFWAELPWRINGFIFSTLAFIVLIVLLHLQLQPIPLLFIPFIILTIVLALFLSFTYKMFISLTAFWITETWALFEAAEIVGDLSAGFILPLTLLPGLLQKITFSLPFAYMIFVPIQALLGKQSIPAMLHGIVIQVVWISIFGVGYSILWKKGISLFTGIGQ